MREAGAKSTPPVGMEVAGTLAFLSMTCLSHAQVVVVVVVTIITSASGRAISRRMSMIWLSIKPKKVSFKEASQ